MTTPTYLPTPQELEARGFRCGGPQGGTRVVAEKPQTVICWADKTVELWDAGGRVFRGRVSSLRDFDIILWSLGMTDKHPNEQ